LNEQASREDDELVVRALELHDEGWSFEQIALAVDRPVWWARDVVTDVLLEERQETALH